MSQLVKLPKMLLETGGKQEIKLFQAINTPRIQELASCDEVLDTLTYCMIVTGIQANKLPTESFTNVLKEFIFDNFKMVRLGEIKHAFDLFASGTLEQYLKKDFGHFQNFSCDFFSGVMKGYKKHIQENKLKVKLLEKMDLIEEEELNQVEKDRLNDKAVKTCIKMGYEVFLNTKATTPQSYLNETHFKFIEYCGLATVSKSERATIWANVNQAIKSESLTNRKTHQSIESYVKESNPRAIYAGRLIVECYKTWMNVNKYTLEHLEGVMKMYSYTEMKSKQS